MAAVQQFRLPDLGEGLTEGEILTWLVQPGEQVQLNQPIVEVETAKAAVEVPSPFAGVVVALHYPAGQTVEVGAPIISIDTDPGGAADGDGGAQQGPVEDLVPPPPDEGFVEPGLHTGALIGQAGPGGRTATLVGYGPKTGPATRRPRAGHIATRSPEAPAPAPVTRISGAATARSAQARAGAVPVLAKPPVRKLARDLGVDLTALAGTGPSGSVTRSDVLSAAEPQPAPVAEPGSRERRVPIRGVRKLTAAAMVHSAFTAPHVTEFLSVDLTETLALRARLQALPEFAGVKVSPLLLVAKALLLSVRRHPEINASWDEAAQEIVVKDYVHLGIAAATPRGLVVPNIKDADRLALPDLARALQELTDTARAGRTLPADMAGGTITITNVGTFGVDSGTPILNPGESAILALGAIRPMPWVVDGQLAVRQVTQLAVSFDHRNVDGELGSRFLADIGRVLSDPATALAWV